MLFRDMGAKKKISKKSTKCMPMSCFHSQPHKFNFKNYVHV